MITIIDYGMGNLGSIANMIKKVGDRSQISSDIEVILNSDKLILPGVGSFDKGMINLKESGLFDAINKKVLVDKIPILGICLGMQLMTNSSEEGKEKGLSWVDAETIKFAKSNLKVPHMGWNTISHEKNSQLFDDYDLEKRFYFVHSYYVRSNSENDILTTTSYGTEFVSSFEKDNIIGVQFHPEKSHKFGMSLMKNFIDNY